MSLYLDTLRVKIMTAMPVPFFIGIQSANIEGQILGHGKTQMMAHLQSAILPPQTYEICFKKYERPKNKDLLPMMMSFLVADVRNALTRLPDVLRSQRMMLFGAGFLDQ